LGKIKILKQPKLNPHVAVQEAQQWCDRPEEQRKWLEIISQQMVCVPVTGDPQLRFGAELIMAMDELKLIIPTPFDSLGG
jgi:hypothetical protein